MYSDRSKILTNIVFKNDVICKISYFTNRFCIFVRKNTSIWLTKEHWNSSSPTNRRKWMAEPMRYYVKGVNKDYAETLKTQKEYVTFCHAKNLDADEFMDEILNMATKAIE